MLITNLGLPELISPPSQTRVSSSPGFRKGKRGDEMGATTLRHAHPGADNNTVAFHYDTFEYPSSCLYGDW